MAVPGDEVGRRLGESGGKWRGVHAAPNGGLGSPGGGRRRQVRGEGRPAVALLASVHAPVREGGSGWVGELQEGDGVPFQGSACAEEGRGVEFGVGRISPAPMEVRRSF